MVQEVGSVPLITTVTVGAEVPMTRLSTDIDSAADVAVTTKVSLPSGSAAPAGSCQAADAMCRPPVTTIRQYASQHRASPAGNEQAAGASRGVDKVPLDQDTTASRLASQHSAGIVAAASALTTMLTLSAETGSSWQIPVHIQKLHKVTYHQALSFNTQSKGWHCPGQWK